MQGLEWGKVNQLTIRHPFSKNIPLIGDMFNMKVVNGFGDSFMPAVQGRTFGASQRLIVRPGDEQKGILTTPGGQSGHFMSEFFAKGFDEYASGKHTPLLPSEAIHTIQFTPMQ